MFGKKKEDVNKKTEKEIEKEIELLHKQLKEKQSKEIETMASNDLADTEVRVEGKEVPVPKKEENKVEEQQGMTMDEYISSQYGTNYLYGILSELVILNNQIKKER